MVKILYKTITISAFCLLLCYDLAFAGNKHMVEKRIQELDQLNKQIVRQLPELPKDGFIDLKAKVYKINGQLKFEIYEKKVVPYKQKSIDFKKVGKVNRPKDEEE